MSKPKLYLIKFLHTHSQQEGVWELYADNESQAMLGAQELLPPSYKILAIHHAPMWQ